MPKKPAAERDDRDKAGAEEAISALDLLEQDHREAEELFDQYEALEDEDEKEMLALQICLALEVHAQIEEEIFYPEARKAIAKPELLDEAIVEHAAAKQLIAEIEAMEVGDKLHDAKVKVLGEQMRHHIDEEENELFPELERARIDLEALGRKLADRKTELLRIVAERGDL